MATVLTIIPYNFYPPDSGGALRCFYLLKQMSLEHDVYVLTTQPEHDFLIEHKLNFPPNVHVVSIYGKECFHSFVNKLLPKKLADSINFRLLQKSIRRKASLYFLEAYPTLSALLKQVKFDIIFYESLEAVSLFASTSKKKSPKALQIYDAHNIDSKLWLQQASPERAVYSIYAKSALEIEKSLYQKVDFFFCCSEDDRSELQQLNKNKLEGIVIPNGVDLNARPYDYNSDKFYINELIFCGSLDYHPNKEGLLWFYKEVFPKVKVDFPEIKLTIIGNGSAAESYTDIINDPSVNFIGKVDDVVPYYKSTSIAIVPLLSGSGTRLKILEAMSLGNPVVSTPVGAEGLNFISGQHMLIASQPDDFAKCILDLLNSKELYDSTRYNAFDFVKSKYDWNSVGRLINSSIHNLCK
jgi:polysaccharide biosynthesis protein PslH